MPVRPLTDDEKPKPRPEPPSDKSTYQLGQEQAATYGTKGGDDGRP